jgi:isopentenyl-diphosphate Delta-isomerase
MSEFNIEVDKHDNVVGLRPRGDFFATEHIHRSSNLILYNSKGEILLQKRAKNKKLYPNVYSFSVSGTVANESYEECILRESLEEIGISVKVKLLFNYHYFDNVDKAFYAIFITKIKDNDLKQIKPEKREISELLWVDPKKLEKDIYENSHKYTPAFVAGMKIYFKKYNLK